MIGNLCEAFGITMEELEPLPSRADLPQDPEADEMGTNTFYPRYNDTCVGTSDDIAESQMSASPLNQRPCAFHRGTVRIVSREELSPIPEVPTPPESVADEEMYTDAVETGGHFSFVPKKCELTPSVALPDSTQPPESIPDPSHEDRPVPPTVNLIRATPQNSQEALLPVQVDLQLTPPDAPMQPALHPTPDAPHLEPMCPDLHLVPATTGSDAPVSDPAVPEPAVPESVAPDPAIAEATLASGGATVNTAVIDPPVSPPPVSEPPVSEPPIPVATVSDPTIPEPHPNSQDTSHPLAPRKRKRAGTVSQIRPRPVPDTLGVPGSSGIRTRSVSLAARPCTRSASRSRSVSVSRGEKRKAENSGDDRESNKRQKA